MMTFSNITGNAQVKNYLAKFLKKAGAEQVGLANHTFLFSGIDGIGKSLFAEEFAKCLVCGQHASENDLRKIEAGNHPDIRILRPEGKSGLHSIDSIRQFIEEVNLAPYEAKWKVFIVHEADRMHIFSANALLKTLEEPYQQSVVILLSSNPDKLLPTILSRCLKIYFQPIQEADIAAYLEKKFPNSGADYRRIAFQAKGSIGRACRLVQQGGDPIREGLIAHLSDGRAASYADFSKRLRILVDLVEGVKKSIEAEARNQCLISSHAEMMAAQKAEVEKEIEGIVSSRLFQEIEGMAELIREWYRDLHLLGLGGDLKFLIHPHLEKILWSQLEQGNVLPLDFVQESTTQFKISYERHISLQTSLETLFLKLKYL
jgi:DNA polymerase-3 subunit delta'